MQAVLLGLALLGQVELEARPPLDTAFVERPLTMPEDTFAILFEVGASQLDTRAPVVFGEVGARYGHTEDFELGLRLVRLAMSPAPDTGLNNPIGFVRYRFLSGIFELAGYLEAEIPVGGTYEANARVESLLRIGSFARVDLSAEAGIFVEEPLRYVASLPLELTFQLGEHVSLSALGILEMRDLGRSDDLLGRAGIRFAYTFGDQGQATADLGILVTTPNLALRGERPDNPAFNNYFLALIDLSWFIANDQSDPWRGFD